MLKILPTQSTFAERFTVRSLQLCDIEDVVTLLNACSQRLRGIDEFTNGDVNREWLTPKFELAQSTLGVWSGDGQLVGYVEVWDLDAPPVDIWVWARVHPDFEGQGIGTHLMQWAEERARQAIARVPDGLRVFMRSGTLSTYQPACQLLESLGMVNVRYFHHMVIDFAKTAVPKPQWPEGISLRTLVDGPDLRQLYEAVEDGFRDHWGHVSRPGDEEFARWQHWVTNEPEFDPALYFMAMDGDEIAAMSLCEFRDRHMPNFGYIDALAVRRPWRRQGIALALLHHSFHELKKRGRAGAGLGVDASSLTGATRLYEKAGMHIETSSAAYEKELRAGKDITLRRLNE